MDYAMKSMKTSKADKPLGPADALYQSVPEQYPYGLRVTLAPETLKKLNLAEIPEVGEMMALHAVVEVVGVNYDGTQPGDKQLRVELQITDMCLEDKGKDPVNEVADQDPDEVKTILGSEVE